LFYLRENLLRRLTFAKYLWILLLMILLLLSLLFPLLATPTKTGNNFEFFGKVATLNGKEYLNQLKFCDYEAIEWLNKNVKGTPVILEAPGDSFKWESCVSANTGLPTLLGWEGHERQWRPNQLQEIAQRKQDVNKIYSLTSYSQTGKISISNSWQAFNWEGDALLTRNEPGTTQEQTAIKISSLVGANANFWQKIALLGGQEYTLTLWVKTSGIQKVGAIDKIAQVHVREDLGDGPGNIIAESVPLLDDNYWTKVEISFFLPENESSIWISCVLGNWGKAKGEIWFDDFSLYGIDYNPAEEEKANFDDALPLIKKYNIQYVYFGNLEREKYPLQSSDRFEEISDLVYNTKETKIYKIKNGI